jgi:steroid delta-isomerase-like uncharacterized protein
MSLDAHRALVQRFYDGLWNAWNDEAVNEVLADDFVFRGSLGTETQGRAGWRAYRDMIRAASPDFFNEVGDVICQGPRAAARVVCSGHHEGPLLGLSATGRPFRYPIAAFFTFRDDRISEAWVLGDLDSLRRQLASAPPLPG